MPSELDLKCDLCANRENVWVCLVCSALGCGRYCSGRHAVKHFQAYNHSFSLELASQRIWHYRGDNYVHRIIKTQVAVSNIIHFILLALTHSRNHSSIKSPWFFRRRHLYFELSRRQDASRKDRQHSSRVQLSPHISTGGTKEILWREGNHHLQIFIDWDSFKSIKV